MRMRRFRVWFLRATILVSIFCLTQTASADLNRPKNATYYISVSMSGKLKDGLDMSRVRTFALYFAGDGTAYLSTKALGRKDIKQDEDGIVVPADRTSASQVIKICRAGCSNPQDNEAVTYSLIFIGSDGENNLEAELDSCFSNMAEVVCERFDFKLNPAGSCQFISYVLEEGPPASTARLPVAVGGLTCARYEGRRFF